MPLTERQITAIQKIIKNRFLGLTYEALGERALSTAELNALKAAGLVEDATKHLVADPYVLGKIVAVLPPSARTLSYDQVLRAAQKLLPTTEREKKAMEYAIDHAGAHIRGVMDMTLRDSTAAIAATRGEALRTIREGVAESIVNRDTLSELKTKLFDLIDDSTRDWQRVAHTEMNNAVQNGILDEIAEKSDEGMSQLVYKRPNPDACDHCRRLYLRPDGRPRVFRLSDLAESNVGKKAADWEATIGSVHPWCACQLIVIPDKHSFVGDHVVESAFTSGSKKYKKGQIVSEAEYSALTSAERENIKGDWLLRFTGETEERTENL